MNSLLIIYNLNSSEKKIFNKYLWTIVTHVENRIRLHIFIYAKDLQFQKAVGPDSLVVLAYVSIQFFHGFSAHICGITFKVNI